MTPLLPLILISIPTTGTFKAPNQRLLSHPIQVWTFHMTSCPNRAPFLIIHHLMHIPIMRTPDPFILYPLLFHHPLLPQTHLQTSGRRGPQPVIQTMHAIIQILLSALSHLWRVSTPFRMRGSHIPVTASIVLNAVRRILPNRRGSMR